MKNIVLTDYSDFFFRQLSDDKAINSLLREIKKEVRSSEEYKQYMKYLKNNLDMSKCTILKGTQNNTISIEMHHIPFTIYDIIMTVILRNIHPDVYDDERPIDQYQIANEVMLLHYKNKVGLVPLTTTIHELYHSGVIYIPKSDIFGDYTSFYNEYKMYMSEEILKRYESFMNEKDGKESMKKILTPSIVDIHHDDVHYKAIDFNGTTFLKQLTK